MLRDWAIDVKQAFSSKAAPTSYNSEDYSEVTEIYNNLDVSVIPMHFAGKLKGKPSDVNA